MPYWRERFMDWVQDSYIKVEKEFQEAEKIMHINSQGTGGNFTSWFCSTCNTQVQGGFHQCITYPGFPPFLPEKNCILEFPLSSQLEKYMLTMKDIGSFTTQELITELLKRKDGQAAKIKELQAELAILESLDFLTGVQSTKRGPVETK